MQSIVPPPTASCQSELFCCFSIVIGVRVMVHYIVGLSDNRTISGVIDSLFLEICNGCIDELIGDFGIRAPVH